MRIYRRLAKREREQSSRKIHSNIQSAWIIFSFSRRARISRAAPHIANTHKRAPWHFGCAWRYLHVNSPRLSDFCMSVCVCVWTIENFERHTSPYSHVQFALRELLVWYIWNCAGDRGKKLRDVIAPVNHLSLNLTFFHAFKCPRILFFTYIYANEISTHGFWFDFEKYVYYL